MRDFDYFDDDAQPLHGTDTDPAEGGLERQIEAFHRRQKRHFRYVLLTAVTFFVCVSFLWGYRQDIAYAFATPSSPRELGDVTQMTPRDIPPNAYVELSGITEPRGLSQKKVRGFGVSRDELWYFRLAGSGGVFIEVLPDKETYGFATRVEVAGRAVDPATDRTYEGLVADFHQRFYKKKQPDLRVIQVGIKPGEGRGPYLIAGILLLALLTSNLVVLVRLVRARRAGVRLR